MSAPNPLASLQPPANAQAVLQQAIQLPLLPLMVFQQVLAQAQGQAVAASTSGSPTGTITLPGGLTI